MDTAEKELPVSTHRGSFTVFGVEIKCHRLSNGQAIIEAESMENLLRVMEEGGGATLDHEEMKKYQDFIKGIARQ